MNKKEIEVICEVFAEKLFKKLKDNQGSSDPEYVTCREAARILGLSEIRLRARKSEFPHIKGGGKSKKGRLLFLKSALITNYENATNI